MWELKRGFVMAVASRAIRFIRVSVKRTSILYESANDSLNEKCILCISLCSKTCS